MASALAIKQPMLSCSLHCSSSLHSSRSFNHVLRCPNHSLTCRHALSPPTNRCAARAIILRECIEPPSLFVLNNTRSTCRPSKHPTSQLTQSSIETCTHIFSTTTQCPSRACSELHCARTPLRPGGQTSLLSRTQGFRALPSRLVPASPPPPSALACEYHRQRYHGPAWYGTDFDWTKRRGRVSGFGYCGNYRASAGTDYDGHYSDGGHPTDWWLPGHTASLITMSTTEEKHYESA